MKGAIRCSAPQVAEAALSLSSSRGGALPLCEMCMCWLYGSMSKVYCAAHAPATAATAAALTRLTPLFDSTANPLPGTRTISSSGKAGEGCGACTTRLRVLEK